MRMQLYKMELYKIFHRKIFWIGILAILGLMFVYFWFAEVGDGLSPFSRYAFGAVSF